MPQTEVLVRMDNYIRQWQSGTDGKALFLGCYRMMTENMLGALEAGAFKNTDWTDRLLHHFADYYFRALEIYNSQAPGLPAVWRYAFDAANEGENAPIQKLLLGVNAHINYDLVLTLHDLLHAEWAGCPEPQRQQYFGDYCYVNEIIGQTVDQVQDEILEPAQPSMRLVDDWMGRMDEWLLSRLITHWRDKVWENTVALLAAPPTEKERIVQSIEARALQRAEAIAGKNWPLGIGKIL
ncbi:MAG: hypothetical protein H6574_12415 [Lewinellaceae bacterium]|nr:hypothetical protein [Saprospiraceae bacterium]MCB9331877.1 hypothetical protein [Lewinellaceae bacterium]